MNQYEIELRDKYFETRLAMLLVKPHGFFVSNVSETDIIKSANDFADKCMAERQKHLDAIKSTNYHEDVGSVEVQCLCGWIGQQHMLVDDKCPDCQAVFSPYPPRKVQGTECNR